jgi:hypothetical protein
LSRSNYVEFGKADKAYIKNTPHVPLRVGKLFFNLKKKQWVYTGEDLKWDI